MQEPTRLPRVVQGQNVGVREVGGDLDLFEKPFDAEEDGEARQEHLEGDLTPMLAVVCQVTRSPCRRGPAGGAARNGRSAPSRGRGGYRRAWRNMVAS